MSWAVPKLWESEECWILGGGPSMPRQFGVPEEEIQKVLNGQASPSLYSSYLEPIHDKNVIGINAAFLIGNWIKVLFFGDKGFFKKNQRAIRKFPNLKITCSNTNRTFEYQRAKVKFVSRNKSHDRGITTHPSKVSWNYNSGAAAISIAYSLGAKRIYLLGFDMKPNKDGKTHWHSAYKGRINDRVFKRHLLGFPFIAKDAKKLNIEIINVNPDSAIEDFPKVNLKDIL